MASHDGCGCQQVTITSPPARSSRGCSTGIPGPNSTVPGNTPQQQQQQQQQRMKYVIKEKLEANIALVPLLDLEQQELLLLVVAIKDISAGQELMLDYGDDYWQARLVQLNGESVSDQEKQRLIAERDEARRELLAMKASIKPLVEENARLKQQPVASGGVEAVPAEEVQRLQQQLQQALKDLAAAQQQLQSHQEGQHPACTATAAAAAAAQGSQAAAEADMCQKSASPLQLQALALPAKAAAVAPAETRPVPRGSPTAAGCSEYTLSAVSSVVKGHELATTAAPTRTQAPAAAAAAAGTETRLVTHNPPTVAGCGESAVSSGVERQQAVAAAPAGAAAAAQSGPNKRLTSSVAVRGAASPASGASTAAPAAHTSSCQAVCEADVAAPAGPTQQQEQHMNNRAATVSAEHKLAARQLSLLGKAQQRPKQPIAGHYYRKLRRISLATCPAAAAAARREMHVLDAATSLAVAGQQRCASSKAPRGKIPFQKGQQAAGAVAAAGVAGSAHGAAAAVPDVSAVGGTGAGGAGAAGKVSPGMTQLGRQSLHKHVKKRSSAAPAEEQRMPKQQRAGKQQQQGCVIDLTADSPKSVHKASSRHQQQQHRARTRITLGPSATVTSLQHHGQQQQRPGDSQPHGPLRVVQLNSRLLEQQQWQQRRRDLQQQQPSAGRQAGALVGAVQRSPISRSPAAPAHDKQQEAHPTSASQAWRQSRMQRQQQRFPLSHTAKDDLIRTAAKDFGVLATVLDGPSWDDVMGVYEQHRDQRVVSEAGADPVVQLCQYGCCVLPVDGL